MPAKEIVRQGCHLDRDAGVWVCTAEAISAAVHGLTDAAFDLAEAREQLEQARALAGIDRAQMAGELWTQVQLTDKARSQRWVWASVGVALGVLLGGGVMALVLH